MAKSGAQWQEIRTLIAECSDLLAAAGKSPIAQGIATVHGKPEALGNRRFLDPSFVATMV